MTTSFAKQFLSATLSLLLVFVTIPFEAAAQAAPAQQSGYSGQGVPLTAEEVQKLQRAVQAARKEPRPQEAV